jgi:hypothetical protein
MIDDTVIEETWSPPNGQSTSFAANAWATTPEEVDHPGFGFELGWADAATQWKPYLIVSFWRWRAQIGWLRW